MFAPARASSREDAAQLLDELLERLLSADQIAAHGVMDRALARGWTVDDVRFELLTPALHEVGTRWARGEIGVGDEHLATSVAESLLVTLAGRTTRTPPSGRRAIVGCSEGELHTLGARLAANVLAEAGWTVLLLGAATPVEAWSPIVRSRHPDAAVVATTLPSGLARVGPTLAAIRAAQPECALAIGGQAYAGQADAARRLGADVLAEDPRELAHRLGRGRGS